MANRISATFDRSRPVGSQRMWTGPYLCNRDHRCGRLGDQWPVLRLSDTWQLVINTGTTIVTFLMVFLIQNTQNRDTEALQLKIDELIRVTEQARNRLINLEDLTEEEMDKVKRELTDIGRADRDNPDTPP